MNSQNENEARAVERAEPVAWDYCPECGCEKTDGGFRDSKFCADCGQEWFPDMDYTSVVRIHLSNRKSSASDIARLTGEVERLQESLDQLTGMKFSDRMHAALVSRAESAERRVAELVESARSFLTASDAYDSAETSSLYPDHQRLLSQYKWSRQEFEDYLTQPEADHGK